MMTSNEQYYYRSSELFCVLATAAGDPDPLAIKASYHFVNFLQIVLSFVM